MSRNPCRDDKSKSAPTVPTKRCPETASAAPSEDCVITRVVIGAQYICGRRNSRAASNEATATTAVRTECTTVGHHTHFTLSLVISAHLCDNPRKDSCSLREGS